MSFLDLSAGTVLGNRYRIVGPHRQGGLSAVLEVHDQEGDQRYELQVFPAGLFDRTTQVAEFAKDLEPWAAVQSEWVVTTRELLTLDDAHIALVTEFPAGQSLRQRLNETEILPESEVLVLGLRLLEGLAAIHEAGLVHGDVKPAAVFVADGPTGPQPTIVDGGVTPGLWHAKGIGERTTLIGTPYYAPVEQFGGDAPTVGSDVYNVATVLYECLTGVLPWPGKTFLEVFQAKLQKVPPTMGERAPGISVDPQLEAVVTQGCRADRHERYASAEEFRDALAALA